MRLYEGLEIVVNVPTWVQIYHILLSKTAVTASGDSWLVYYKIPGGEWSAKTVDYSTSQINKWYDNGWVISDNRPKPQSLPDDLFEI